MHTHTHTHTCTHTHAHAMHAHTQTCAHTPHMHTRARPTRGDPFHIRTRTRTHFLFQGRLELVIEISYAICSMGGVTFAFFVSFRGRRRGGCIFVILG